MPLPFSESQLDALRSRVQDAEKGTPGEIVVVVVRKSGSYEAVLWRGGTFALLIVLVLWGCVGLAWQAWGIGWLWSPAFGVALCGGATVLGAILAAKNGAVFRILAGKKLLQRTVHRRAQRSFLEGGVSETAARTGILLFVSLLERRIEVIADKGINAVVPNEQWQEIVDLIRAGLGRGEAVRGLSDGIAACGDVLRRSGISTSASDVNELSDDIRFESD